MGTIRQSWISIIIKECVPEWWNYNSGIFQEELNCINIIKDCGYSFFLTSIKWVYHRLNASKTRHPDPFFRGVPFQGANIWYFLQK